MDRNKVIDDYRRLEGLQTSNLDSRGWMMDVMACVDKIGNTDFTLDEMYAFEPILQKKYPQNYHIKDKIRQQLQFLRDKGFVRFTARGHYQKI